MKKELALQKICIMCLTTILVIFGIMLCMQEKRIEKIEKHCDYLQIREMELSTLIGAGRKESLESYYSRIK